MTNEEFYNDFKLMRQMKAPIETKVILLTHLFGAQENPWRVVGVTTEALKVFREHGFKKVVKMGINRSHIVNRNDSYREMLSTDFMSCEDWWNFYYENDKTIFATSSENLTKNHSTEILIDENLDLFRSQGYSWKHGVAERTYLEQLYNNKFIR